MFVLKQQNSLIHLVREKIYNLKINIDAMIVADSLNVIIT